MAHVLTKPAPTAPPAPPRRSRRRRDILVGWSFILPNFVGFALFTLVPMLAAFALAFLEWDSYSAPEWVGLDNFAKLIDDENFHVALRNTLFYAAGHIPLTLVAALGLAMALNRKLRGVPFFRTAAFFPYITSLVAVAVVWNMLFNPTAGPVNQVLEAIGVSDPPRWVASTDWAMPAVIITSVWRDMGYYMVLYLAGLQTIPKEYYEAARVDGANAWQRFWSITVPCLRPTTFFVVVMLTIQSFKVLDLIVVMTDGGPGRSTLVLAQLVYREGITEGQFGYSSAIALVLFVIVLTVTVVQFRINERRSAS
ncbi:carbohydrate ABC transporter permease [Nonomuraea muscovyensis]|uniref:Multiple sugar transport system permease protein/alpha-1,4-digalacturonate transport system permease protein n=1 Tax=Nonomuraea muscovyensis TaxID=1124761 RepID=A0A7X0C192_9ACTN|nr:sugar ABC transporter permease [Nonomuraea muscovyensis]MBB6345585.1 multiple sugar transport system permease protein/alpha-1,4-digalacturonate transport system permease protein [Nonomuraea muscovyensis]MDF2704758.1 binding-protein-dependent transport system inner rane component [Nonomuraea muscovyensis]